MIAKIERFWLMDLTVVLAGCYLILGVIVGGLSGLAGIAGGVLIGAALVLRERSRWIAVVLLVAGALPFAALLWWSVIVPILALVTLVLGGLVIVRRGDRPVIQRPLVGRPSPA